MTNFIQGILDNFLWFCIKGTGYQKKKKKKKKEKKKNKQA